jgi:hypothetical protein
LELANRERMALISQSTETGLTNAIRVSPEVFPSESGSQTSEIQFASDTDIENPPKQTFVSEGEFPFSSTQSSYLSLILSVYLQDKYPMA